MTNLIVWLFFLWAWIFLVDFSDECTKRGGYTTLHMKKSSFDSQLACIKGEELP